jgi:hypothetical protein
MTERRMYERKTVPNPVVWIELGHGHRLIPCHIENASDGGAKLIVRNACSLPTEFQLRFSLTSETRRTCIVTRRLPEGVAVQFEKGT